MTAYLIAAWAAIAAGKPHRPIAGETLRAKVERALRQLVAHGDESTTTRRQRIVEHIAHASSHVDLDVLLSDEAWRETGRPLVQLPV